MITPYRNWRFEDKAAFWCILTVCVVFALSGFRCSVRVDSRESKPIPAPDATNVQANRCKVCGQDRRVCYHRDNPPWRIASDPNHEEHPDAR